MMELSLPSVLSKSSFPLLLSVFILLFGGARAQQWYIVDSLSFKETVVSVSRDLTGNLYLAYASGKLRKYDDTLLLMASSHEGSPDLISSIDASQILKILVFYQEPQQFQFFNRFLNPIHSPQSFNTESFAHFSIATLSSDQMIWLINDDLMRLQKYNPILQEFVVDTDLSYYLQGNFQVSKLAEHKNRLYMQYNDEILVFDFMGNFINKLPLEIKGPFSLHQDHLFFLQKEKLFKYHLEKMEVVDVGITSQEKVIFLLSDSKRHYLLTEKKIIVFRENQ